MAFFDDLGKKISQAGQSAVQKTKDMTDIARIHAAINEEEKKIEARYYQIGKLYAVLHAKDPEPEMVAAVEAVLESAGKIAEYRKQIQTIRSIVVCEKCGAQLSDQALFCNNCGTRIAPMGQEEADRIICKGCGKPLAPGTRFCGGCGLPVTELPQPDNPKSEEEPQSEAVPRFCGNCGAETEPEMAFCAECGTKLK